jgi:hypothetical protein
MSSAGSTSPVCSSRSSLSSRWRRQRRSRTGGSRSHGHGTAPNPQLLVAVCELAAAIDENGGQSCSRERVKREPPLDFENILGLISFPRKPVES